MYCEVCGKELKGIRSPERLLAWLKMQKAKACHHECRYGERQFDPRTGQRLPSFAERFWMKP